MKTKPSLLLLLGLGVMLSLWPAVAQQTTAFTYQGQLRDGGTNANGTYSMMFKLYNAVTDGNQIGSAITNSPTLANGLFSVNLDFGAGAFDGNARWLDITVTNGGTTQILSPRVQVLPAPYSLYASYAYTSGSTSGSVTTGPWTIHSGNFMIPDGTPNGGSANDNVLIFSANGIDWMGISPVGGGLIARSQFTVGGPIYADNLQLNSGGGTVYGDGRGGLVLNKKVFISSTGEICGNIVCQGSDRNLKENFSTIDGRDILERVVSLPISNWNFKQDKQTRHIGPMAQDFYAAFNVGSDDKHIATVDEGGVALAAIQGLNEKLKEKDARIESLEKRLADLEKLVKPFGTQ